jgi:hypothetical protein
LSSAVALRDESGVVPRFVSVIWPVRGVPGATCSDPDDGLADRPTIVN